MHMYAKCNKNIPCGSTDRLTDRWTDSYSDYCADPRVVKFIADS